MVVPPLLDLHWPHCTALHSLHPEEEATCWCTTCTVTTSPASSILVETSCQTGMLSQLFSSPSSPLTCHISSNAGRCVPAGDVYALTAGGGLSFARECDVRAQFLLFTCTHCARAQFLRFVRVHCARALSNTVRARHCKAHSLSPPTNPSSPSPFNLFPFASFVCPPKQLL